MEDRAESHDKGQQGRTAIADEGLAQNGKAPGRVGAAGLADEGHARPATGTRSLLTRARIGLSSAGAVVLGIAPHVLHHAGPLAGAALVAGVGGSLLFGAIGLLLSIPLLVRLRRRTGSWRLPAAMLALFAIVFSLSTFVVGPAITGGDDPAGSSSQPAGGSHEDHHP